MNKRYEAMGKGEKTYNSGKPCRKGHMSDRYSSNGMCIECLKGQRTTYTNAVGRRNQMRMSHMHTFEVSTHVQYKQLVDDITDIMLECGHRADLLAQYIMLLGDSELRAADLERLLTRNASGHITNPMRSGADGQTETQIMGEWYRTGEVYEVLSGKRDRVVRVRKEIELERVGIVPTAAARPAVGTAPPVYDGPNTGLTDADREFFRRDRELYGDD